MAARPTITAEEEILTLRALPARLRRWTPDEITVLLERDAKTMTRAEFQVYFLIRERRKFPSKTDAHILMDGIPYGEHHRQRDEPTLRMPLATAGGDVDTVMTPAPSRSKAKAGLHEFMDTDERLEKEIAEARMPSPSTLRTIGLRIEELRARLKRRTKAEKIALVRADPTVMSVSDQLERDLELYQRKLHEDKKRAEMEVCRQWMRAMRSRFGKTKYPVDYALFVAMGADAGVRKPTTKQKDKAQRTRVKRTKEYNPENHPDRVRARRERARSERARARELEVHEVQEERKTASSAPPVIASSLAPHSLEFDDDVDEEEHDEEHGDERDDECGDESKYEEAEVEERWELVKDYATAILDARPEEPGRGLFLVDVNPITCVVHQKLVPVLIAMAIVERGGRLDCALYDCAASDADSLKRAADLRAAGALARFLMERCLVKPRAWTGVRFLHFHLPETMDARYDESLTAMLRHYGTALDHPAMREGSCLVGWTYDDLAKRAGYKSKDVTHAVTFTGLDYKSKDRRDFEDGLRFLGVSPSTGYTTSESFRMTMSFDPKVEDFLIGMEVHIGQSWSTVERASEDEVRALRHLVKAAQKDPCRKCFLIAHQHDECTREREEVRCIRCSEWGHERTRCRITGRSAFCANCGGVHTLGSHNCLTLPLERRRKTKAESST
jgi:hypothetical protein